MISKNPYQGDHKRVLFVCSGGILRSATASHITAEKFGWNTRAAGTHPYALIPVTQTLFDWADKVYFMMKENLIYAQQRVDLSGDEVSTKVKILDIPDNYAYRDPVLVERILKALENE